ncbi:R-LORF8 [Gallid alphaherpesvirus 2]|uniref:R-LORF8 n=2 Tax=Alphaherpesvirinae TaxID=10293 RepID=Q9IBJ3_9ALPH|nr:R-LORF8 [Gallid alphaherpesvirus 2]AAF67211.1 R-LORF8 [Gallid alphaherpesvirus 2]
MTIVFISPNSVIPNPIQYYITSTVYRRSTMVFQRSFPPERSCCQNHSWSPNEGFRYSIKLHRGHSKQAQSRHVEHVSSRSLPSRKLFCGSPFKTLQTDYRAEYNFLLGEYTKYNAAVGSLSRYGCHEDRYTTYNLKM